MKTNEISSLLKKYPFLIIKGYNGKSIFSKKDLLSHNYYTYWDNTGWSNIWKDFLHSLFTIYDELSDHDKSLISIWETKEKYGYLRIDLTYPSSISKSEEVEDLINQLELLSSVTCINCGKIPKNSKGQSIIWRTRGWIAPLCKECARNQMIEAGYTKSEIKSKLKIIREVNPLFIIKSSSLSVSTEKQYVLSNNKLKLKKKIITEIAQVNKE